MSVENTNTYFDKIEHEKIGNGDEYKTDLEDRNGEPTLYSDYTKVYKWMEENDFADQSKVSQPMKDTWKAKYSRITNFQVNSTTISGVGGRFYLEFLFAGNCLEGTETELNEATKKWIKNLPAVKTGSQSYYLNLKYFSAQGAYQKFKDNEGTTKDDIINFFYKKNDLDYNKRNDENEEETQTANEQIFEFEVNQAKKTIVESKVATEQFEKNIGPSKQSKQKYIDTYKTEISSQVDAAITEAESSIAGSSNEEIIAALSAAVKTQLNRYIPTVVTMYEKGIKKTSNDFFDNMKEKFEAAKEWINVAGQHATDLLADKRIVEQIRALVLFSIPLPDKNDDFTAEEREWCNKYYGFVGYLTSLTATSRMDEKLQKEVILFLSSLNEKKNHKIALYAALLYTLWGIRKNIAPETSSRSDLVSFTEHLKDFKTDSNWVNKAILLTSTHMVVPTGNAYKAIRQNLSNRQKTNLITAILDQSKRSVDFKKIALQWKNDLNAARSSLRVIEEQLPIEKQQATKILDEKNKKLSAVVDQLETKKTELTNTTNKLKETNKNLVTANNELNQRKSEGELAVEKATLQGRIQYLKEQLNDNEIEYNEFIKISKDGVELLLKEIQDHDGNTLKFLYERILEYLPK